MHVSLGHASQNTLASTESVSVKQIAVAKSLLEYYVWCNKGDPYTAGLGVWNQTAIYLSRQVSEGTCSEKYSEPSFSQPFTYEFFFLVSSSQTSKSLCTGHSTCKHSDGAFRSRQKPQNQNAPSIHTRHPTLDTPACPADLRLLHRLVVWWRC